MKYRTRNINGAGDGRFSCTRNSLLHTEYSLKDLILRKDFAANAIDAEIVTYEQSNCSVYNPGLITTDDLSYIMPAMSQDNAKNFIGFVRHFFSLYRIDTIGRITSFVGNSAEESRQWNQLAESFLYRAKGLHGTFSRAFPTIAMAQEAIGAGEVYPDHARQIGIANRAYAGKNGNGNEASGDGWTYRGRGIMQITGRATYQSFTDDLGIDIVSNPDIVETPHYSIFTGCWFWHKHNLNSYADIAAFEELAQKINGAWPPYGWATRETFRKRALQRLKSNIENSVFHQDYRY